MWSTTEMCGVLLFCLTFVHCMVLTTVPFYWCLTGKLTQQAICLNKPNTITCICITAEHQSLCSFLTHLSVPDCTTAVEGTTSPINYLKWLLWICTKFVKFKKKSVAWFGRREKCDNTCLQGKYGIQIGQCTLTELHPVLTFLFLP